MERSVVRYVAFICGSAAVAAALVAVVAPQHDTSAVGAVIFLVGLGLVADRLVYTLPQGAWGTISFIPYLAAACIAPDLVPVVAVAVAMLVGMVLSKAPPIKAVFNVAQHVLSLSAAIVIYRLLGGADLFVGSDASLLATIQRGLFPVGALLVVFLGLNSVAVSGVVARSQGLRVLDVWKKNSASMFFWDLACGLVVLVLAWVYVQWGAIGAGLLALPLLGLRQLYKTNLQLQQVNQDLLELMVKAIEARDPYTSGHSRRVAQHAVTIARALSLSPRDIERVRTAALLHDVGKIHEVFAPILSKPDKLTAAEWAIMKTHPIKSAELVATATHLRDLVPAVRHHHENWDGSGYPDGLCADSIPIESRIIMFADTIDAMTTERPYRGALGEADVRAELYRCRGTQFDPEISDRLLDSPSFSQLFPPDKREARLSRPSLIGRRITTPTGQRAVATK